MTNQKEVSCLQSQLYTFLNKYPPHLTIENIQKKPYNGNNVLVACLTNILYIKQSYFPYDKYTPPIIYTLFIIIVSIPHSSHTHKNNMSHTIRTTFQSFDILSKHLLQLSIFLQYLRLKPNDNQLKPLSYHTL